MGETRAWAKYPCYSGLLLLVLLIDTLSSATAEKEYQARLRRPASNLPSSYPEDPEDIFVQALSAQSARASLHYLTSIPHMAGTPGDLKMAQYVQAQWQSFGIEAEIQPVPALLSYPREDTRPSLTLEDGSTKSTLFAATLSEPFLPEDSTSDTWLRNHTFLGYAPSGEVKAPLVYANFGRPEDFEVLAEAGVIVEGSIVLMRYGECFRGLKVMNAEKRGAVGALIYSDPEQDGYALGPTYPEGPWRPAFGVQRGSVQFLSLCAGDPGRTALAEDGGSAEDVCGYATEDLKPKIPVLPISYGDATPFLQSLANAGAESPVAPASFQGALNLTYHLGPSRDRVVMATHNREVVGTVWNVIGVVESPHYGRARDRVVVLGNHRDAWVDGAVDPNSGTASQMEVAKGLGALLRRGWRPRRTLVLASWSGEELGLIGSTAWGEAHAAELKEKAVLYVNVDSAVSGPFFHAGATPSLRPLLETLQEDVLHPYSGEPVARNFSAVGGIEILGSGSDYTVFLDHLGISSIDMGAVIDRFKRPYGMYHSTYDSFSWMSRFGDPTFELHVMVAELWGRLALRVADALVLPLEHTAQATALHAYVEELKARVGTSMEAAPESLDLAPLEAAVRAYEDAAEQVTREAAGLRSSGVKQDREQALAALNDRLAFTERRFCAKEGLPRRKWFKHVLQAPGLYLGYAGVSFPGVTQALGDGDWELAQRQVWVAAERVGTAAAYLAWGDREGGRGGEGVAATK